jgi:hypothetical protein
MWPICERFQLHPQFVPLDQIENCLIDFPVENHKHPTLQVSESAFGLDEKSYKWPM